MYIIHYDFLKVCIIYFYELRIYSNKKKKKAIRTDLNEQIRGKDRNI